MQTAVKMHFLKLPHIFIFPFSFEAITEVGMNTPPLPLLTTHHTLVRKKKFMLKMFPPLFQVFHEMTFLLLQDTSQIKINVPNRFLCAHRNNSSLLHRPAIVVQCYQHRAL